MQMTRIVLPGMKERRKGAIVNIGSAAATVAPSGPLYSVYAGTKVSHDQPQSAFDDVSCGRLSYPDLNFQHSSIHRRQDLFAVCW